MFTTCLYLITIFLALCNVCHCHQEPVRWSDTSVSVSTDLLTLRVNTDGSYSLAVNDEQWLLSYDTFFTIGGKTYSKLNGTLHLVSDLQVSREYDSKLGAFTKTSLTWQADDSAKTLIVTSFNMYEDSPAVVFTQDFSHAGLPGSSVGDENKVCTSFPSFYVPKKMASNLGFMSYGHIFIHDVAVGSWASGSKDIQSGLYGGPLSIFNASGVSLVMSAFNEFMASSVYYDPASSVVMQGVMGRVQEIPKGYQLQTVVHFGNRLKKAWFEWGDMLLKNYGTKRLTDTDPSLKYLGYWTDNGAFYYYNMEVGKNYEQTLLDVKKYAEENYIPYRYLQLDSWWYYKGLHGGVKNWTAMPFIFPDGLKKFNQMVGLNFHAHNRWWAPDTDYAKQNGGKYEFIVEAEKALPQDKNFWDYLLASSKEWGLFLYEQDWLNQQFESMNATLENITVGRTWLMDMAYGAKKNNMYLQYCMPMARHLLQSVEIPQLTQARASGDYQPGNGQWDIGFTSIMHHAIGIHPFKDNFWTTQTQPGNVYFKSEKHPHLQTVVAALSTGPVGPSDKIGYSNISLINRTCNSDGVLLMPSRPAMMIDASIQNMALGSGTVSGQIWSTYSLISNYTFGTILSIETGKPIKLVPADADLEMPDPSFAFADGSMDLQQFDSNHKLTVGPSTVDEYQLWHASPGIGFMNDTYVFMGEMTKIVAVSPNRVQNLSVSKTAIHMKVLAGTRETVQFTFQTVQKKSVFTVSCFSASGGTIGISVTGPNQYKCM